MAARKHARKLPRIPLPATPPLPTTSRTKRRTDYPDQQETALDPNSALQVSRRSRAELQREIVPRLLALASGRKPELAKARQIFFPLTTWAPVPLLERILSTIEEWHSAPPSPATILARAKIWESERTSKAK